MNAMSEQIRQIVDQLGRPDEIDDQSLQALLGACVKAYSLRVEAAHGHIPPYLAEGSVTPTDAIRTAAGLLRESDVSSFELAMMFNV